MRVRRSQSVAAASVCFAATLAACGSSGSGKAAGRPAAVTAPLTFAMWGDTPYSPAEAQAVPKLVDQVNAAKPAFSIFVGDLQGGDPCLNTIYRAAADTFNSFEEPMVYVPGDNEWTDCHRTAQDPIERLGYIRRTMFATDKTFGQTTMTVAQQRPQYPENSRWTAHGIVFIGLNVPGSNDNHIEDVTVDEPGTPRGLADRQAAEAEYQARDQADRDWLHQGFVAAEQSGAPAVVVAMQADPGFDVAPADRAASGVDGFDRLLAAFATEATAFAKPVFILHGDSHTYRFDHPLIDPATGQPVTNVTRIETFGSPRVGWVGITIDPKNPAAVSVDPHLVISVSGN